MKFWVKDSFASRGNAVRVDDSLAKTIKETSHVRGGIVNPNVSSEDQLQIIVKGNDAYRNSFKNKDD